jgi:molybdopterin-guanine dinucleotide biosynthesis protein A
MDGVSAFVLAGGQSSRMGRDKAFVEVNGRTLLARALELCASVSNDVHVVGNRDKFAAFGRVLEDELPNHGPLAGIHAALRASANELNLVLAVDMPFIEVKFLQYLVGQARNGSACITVPRAGGGWQPLCAVYRKTFADVADRALRVNCNKIDPLFAQVDVRIVEEEEMLQHDFSADMFRNLNTPEELHAAGLSGNRELRTGNRD